jgi:hypothetical protein
MNECERLLSVLLSETEDRGEANSDKGIQMAKKHRNLRQREEKLKIYHPRAG